MAIQKITVPDAPDVAFTVVLDNTAYDLRMHWNGRDEAWYLFVGKQNTDYSFKVKVTTNSDLLKVHRANINCPKGMLIVVDTMKRYGRITRNDLNTRFNMLYLPKEDKDLLETTLDVNEEINFTIDTTEDTRFTKSATRL